MPHQGTGEMKKKMKNIVIEDSLKYKMDRRGRPAAVGLNTKIRTLGMKRSIKGTGITAIRTTCSLILEANSHR